MFLRINQKDKSDWYVFKNKTHLHLYEHMNFILRFFFTISTVSFFVVVYLVQNKINPFDEVLGKYAWLIYIVYVLFPFILTCISLRICKLLARNSIKKIQSIEPLNNDFLATYLAFFFVALSIKGTITFWIVFGMTVLFTFVSRVSYFNPVLLVFGYNFYYIVTGENVKIMLISKQKLKAPNNFDHKDVGRINDYIFIDI